MDSIAVTRPHMAVLSQGKLPLTPFGALAQAFAEEVLARAELEEGRYPYVPLELLEEGEEAPPVQAPAPVLQVDLHLILEALRKEQGRTEQVRTTERIVERILRLQKERETRTVERTGRPDREPVKGPGTIHQEFVQVLNQDIRLFSVQGKRGGAVPLRGRTRPAGTAVRRLFPRAPDPAPGGKASLRSSLGRERSDRRTGVRGGGGPAPKPGAKDGPAGDAPPLSGGPLLPGGGGGDARNTGDCLPGAPGG